MRRGLAGAGGVLGNPGMNTTAQERHTLAGYRRRIRLVPQQGQVSAAFEDDVHRMSVVLRHEGGVVLSVETSMERSPWDTCPGAQAVLRQTFEGQPLSAVTARREKKQNCTHLHDMAVLAAAHAGDGAETVFDIHASDPVDGERVLEVFRNGVAEWRWIERGGVLVSPTEVAGLVLMGLRDWIASLAGARQESARLLQWASLVAHGRTMDRGEQDRASALPASCYTLQPERAATAQRVGWFIDFSTGEREPLD